MIVPSLPVCKNVVVVGLIDLVSTDCTIGLAVILSLKTDISSIDSKSEYPEVSIDISWALVAKTVSALPEYLCTSETDSEVVERCISTLGGETSVCFPSAVISL